MSGILTEMKERLAGPLGGRQNENLGLRVFAHSERLQVMDFRRWVKIALCVTMGMSMSPMVHAQEMEGSASVSVNAGGGSPPPENPPTCPIEYLGELNGIHYYVTSNCVDKTGYGSSTQMIPVPQCQPGGICGQPIAGTNHSAGRYMITLLEPPVANMVDVGKWIQELQARKAVIEKGVNGRSQADTRRAQLVNQLDVLNATLQKLNDPNLPAEAKQKAYDDYKVSMEVYTKSFRFVGLASPNSQRIGILDVKSNQPLKTAAETSYSTANVNAGRVTVRARKTKVLKVQTAPRQFVFFQCFDVQVEMPGNAAIVALKLGVQVKPDGVVNSEVAEFSERGNFAHRLRDSSNSPYLVNSIDGLEPQ